MAIEAKVIDRHTKEWFRLHKLVKERSFEYGDFTLSSGKKSSYYFDGKQVTLHPEGSYLVGKILYQKIQGLNIDAVGGYTIGADPMVSAFGVVAHLEGLNNLKLFIVRKTPKTHGKCKNIEGPLLKKGDQVVVVDDVITTGGSVIKSIDAVRELGCHVIKVIALVDREEGGTEAIQNLGIDVDPIFTIRDFPIK